MAGLKERFRRWYNDWQAEWNAEWPSPNARKRAWFDMMWFDHGFLRILWRNHDEVAPGIWRANQPGPKRLRELADLGMRSIINLRGESGWGTYFLEKEVAEEAGVELLNARLYSRRPPTREEALRYIEALDAAPRPVLLHCKSGADRAGLAAAMALLDQGASAEEAARELSLRYLHIRQAKTGILDAFIAHYGAYQATGDLPFRRWLAEVYDPAEVKPVKGKGFGNFLVEKVLARE
ncbi:fused DSP-PTPase phosphatase/NAD kinase-like protein [Algicella marina]|uniref:fused DSP-PTPase phosphatase/NAD kinase-like protein n=1 Tax=Algicella marina TaxID=2683284 RepID=UPI00137979F2|nr:sulfur transferase domain-containing protein [Algicella marina]